MNQPYRHPTLPGTVLTWVDKTLTKHTTLVLDAQCRASSYQSPSHSIAGMEAVEGCGFIPSCEFNFLAIVPPPIPSIYTVRTTDAEINASELAYDPNTSKNNTDVLYARDSSNKYAAYWCRHIGGEIQADLPNIQTLIRIYCYAARINELDPTLDNYPEYKLGQWMWSSSIHTSITGGWCIHERGEVNIASRNNIKLLITPIIEL